jgi:mRNA interferase HigB
LAEGALVQFWESGHGDAAQPLKAWHALAKAASWNHPKEIKEKFSSASFLANNRVVFNISGNKYRLVVKVEYELKAVYIRFIGSHADYDKIDASTI